MKGIVAYMTLDPRRIEVVDDLMAAVLRGKSGSERLAMADNMWRMVRGLIEDKLRQDHPDWSEDLILRETARRLSHGAV